MIKYFLKTASGFRRLISNDSIEGLLPVAFLCVTLIPVALAESLPPGQPPATETPASTADATPSATPDSNATTASQPEVQLPAYSATYTASKSGISAELKQTLQPVNGRQWRLHNETSILFFSFEEEAVFTLDERRIKPLTYRYDNSTSSSRSSQLVFDWDKHSVFDQLHSKKPLKLEQATWDKLSVQAQIRLDLMQQGDSFNKKQYTQIDRTKTKTYTVRKLGEETLSTPLGYFQTIKLEERRDGRDKYTLIWLAKNWDYMILRLQRIEEGEVEYQIDLAEATVNGEPIKPGSHSD